jgi:hypothetical protein
VLNQQFTSSVEELEEEFEEDAEDKTTFLDMLSTRSGK